MEYITKEILEHKMSDVSLSELPPSEVNKETYVLDILAEYFKDIITGAAKMKWDNPVKIFLDVWIKLGYYGGHQTDRYLAIREQVALTTKKLINQEISLKDAFMEAYSVEDIQSSGL